MSRLYRDGAKRRVGGGSSSDPMIEAGAPGTGEDGFRGVPAPPGVDMVSPPETPRNASEASAQSERPRR
jgi:hypothetical protein